METNESYYIIPYNSLADVCQMMSYPYDTTSNVKLTGFQYKLDVSYESCRTEDLLYNETVCV